MKKIIFNKIYPSLLTVERGFLKVEILILR